MKRRDFLTAAAALGATAAISGNAKGAAIIRKGRIRQGLWPSVFGVTSDGAPRFNLEEMCREAARLGAHGFDLMPFDAKPVLDRYGLNMLLVGGGEEMDLLTGIVHREFHDDIEHSLKSQADLCTQHGVKIVAALSGQLRGLSYKQAADNAVELLKRVREHFEARGVFMTIENVNDRRASSTGLGRDDMAFNHWDWGVEVIERVASPNVKLVCDIYHLQIMDGDVTRRIEESIHHIAHFHVAGVPTRTEIGEGQELNYRHIAEVIAATDYDGYVSHEWRPSPGRDPLDSIAQAMDIMDV